MRKNAITALLSALSLAGCSGEGAGPSTGGSGPLEPPPPGAGVQYRMTSTLQPGQEIERCKLFVAPPEGLYVHRDEVVFSPGSHHVLLFETSYTEIPTETRRGVAVDAAEVHDCGDGARADWDVRGAIAGSQSFAGDSMLGTLPEGVALRVEPGTVLVMNTHYLNASAEAVEADARINLHTIPPDEVRTEAGMLFYYNPFIHVPAYGSGSARMRCAVDRDISIVRLQSHMHRRGVNFVANLVGNDGAMSEIYTNTAWEQVPAQQFSPPLRVEAGQALDYRCDYENPEARDVVQGLTTRDEMCMLIGPYYPRAEHLDRCAGEGAASAATWVGSGAATCAESLGCIVRASLSDGDGDGGGGVFGCVVDSCPSAADELSGALRCMLNECAAACFEGGDACAACAASACGEDLAACAAAACD